MPIYQRCTVSDGGGGGSAEGTACLYIAAMICGKEEDKSHYTCTVDCYVK